MSISSGSLASFPSVPSSVSLASICFDDIEVIDAGSPRTPTCVGGKVDDDEFADTPVVVIRQENRFDRRDVPFELRRVVVACIFAYSNLRHLSRHTVYAALKCFDSYFSSPECEEEFIVTRVHYYIGAYASLMLFDKLDEDDSWRTQDYVKQCAYWTKESERFCADALIQFETRLMRHMKWRPHSFRKFTLFDHVKRLVESVVSSEECDAAPLSPLSTLSPLSSRIFNIYVKCDMEILRRAHSSNENVDQKRALGVFWTDWLAEKAKEMVAYDETKFLIPSTDEYARRVNEEYVKGMSAQYYHDSYLTLV